MEEFSRVLKVQHHFIHTSEGVRENQPHPLLLIGHLSVERHMQNSHTFMPMNYWLKGGWTCRLGPTLTLTHTHAPMTEDRDASWRALLKRSPFDSVHSHTARREKHTRCVYSSEMWFSYCSMHWCWYLQQERSSSSPIMLWSSCTRARMEMLTLLHWRTASGARGRYAHQNAFRTGVLMHACLNKAQRQALQSCNNIEAYAHSCKYEYTVFLFTSETNHLELSASFILQNIDFEVERYINLQSHSLLFFNGHIVGIHFRN